MQKSVPKDIPNLLDIKRTLPEHFFQPKLSISFYYVFKDLFIIGALFSCLLFIDYILPTSAWPVKLIYLPLYWYFQGTMFWALFVLGHDCGHGSFSSFSMINDIIGNLLHMMILVPYYPWKISHRQHHKNTGNIDKEEILFPVREKYTKNKLSFNAMPLLPYFGFGTSWFGYLVIGYGPRRTVHLNPFDPLFKNHILECVISLALSGVWIGLALIPYANAFGFLNLITHYLAPVFVFASWLVVTTFLHHQDEMVPWYSDHNWSFVKGQLSSVDRHYGWAHNLVHNIGTHQIHHLFSKVI